MHTKEEKLAQFGRILDVMDKLRAECPWNHAQTIDTLRPMTIEEVYEPYLIKEGFVKRTPRGREVTDKAYEHLGRRRFDGESYTLF